MKEKSARRGERFLPRGSANRTLSSFEERGGCSALAIRQGVEIFFFSFLSLVSRLSSYFLPHTHTQTSSREQGRAREQRKPGGKISGVTRENSGEKFPLSPATAKGKKTVCEKARRGCGSKSFFFPLFFFFLASLPFFFFSLSTLLNPLNLLLSSLARSRHLLKLLQAAGGRGQ